MVPQKSKKFNDIVQSFSAINDRRSPHSSPGHSSVIDFFAPLATAIKTVFAADICALRGFLIHGESYAKLLSPLPV